jgi:hypothetical protein
MTETEGAGDEELFSTLFPPGRPFLIGGPAIRVRREGGGWVRPHPGHLGRFPHRSTSARIVCSWTKNRPTLVAVVACRHKRAAPGLHGRSECANWTGSARGLSVRLGSRHRRTASAVISDEDCQQQVHRHHGSVEGQEVDLPGTGSVSFLMTNPCRLGNGAWAACRRCDCPENFAAYPDRKTPVAAFFPSAYET